ncbi:hypothetical protein FA13DRAFT_1704189 [Coprinellus micaceus]|uniref:Uncharacterized protein n=1 Tax=Coprinellus micaceus TaxID=71717 RepID=A0A4Y7U2S4_COPMI|nr:hypothetical protein FA13DRAFT_1704189 [Coprinellus micaceus]
MHNADPTKEAISMDPRPRAMALSSRLSKGTLELGERMTGIRKVYAVCYCTLVMSLIGRKKDMWARDVTCAIMGEACTGGGTSEGYGPPSLARADGSLSSHSVLHPDHWNLAHSMVVRNGLRLIAPIKSEYHSLKEAPITELASRSSLASPETSRLAEPGVNCTALRVWLDFVGRGLTKLSASSAFGRESNRKREGEGGWRGHATRTLAHVVPKAWMSSPEAQRLEAGARGYTTLLVEGIATCYVSEVVYSLAKGAWSSNTSAIYAKERPSTGSSPATLPLKRGRVFNCT